MSRRMRKQEKKESSENLVSSFIDNEKEDNEPIAKKPKTSAEKDPNDSLKFFKKLRPKQIKPGTSSSSNVAASFVNEVSKTLPSKATTRPKQVSKKKQKAQPDIRKVLNKQEQMFNQVIAENCLPDGIDPDEMQLALAISESLKEQNTALTRGLEVSASTANNFENPFNSLGKVQQISAVLERFGFKSKKQFTEYELDLISNSKVSKRSKFQKLPSALTRMTKDKRDEHIRMKIEKILQQEQSSKKFDFTEASDYNVHSFYLQEFQEKVQRVFIINCENRPTEDVLLSYYVTDLVEPSFVAADHLLKDWSKVPGRESTPERNVDERACREESINSLVDNGVVVDSSDLKASQKLSTNISATMQSETIVTHRVLSSEAQEELVVGENNTSRDSCIDIFADLTESDEDSDNLQLASKLGMLSVKLSQSMIKISETVGSRNEKVLDISSDSVDKTEIAMSTEAKEENSAYANNFEELIDLTLIDKLESTIPIPYDDSFYSLQKFMKSNPMPIDLVSNEDDDRGSNMQVDEREIESTTHLKNNEKALNIEDDDDDDEHKDEHEKNNLKLSQASLDNFDDDDVIYVSDEEITYSTRIHLNNDENFSDKGEIPKQETVDLTQELLLDENESTEFEINNQNHQLLAEVMDLSNDCNINTTITSLLETTAPLKALDKTGSNRLIKIVEDNGLSDSIEEIIKKYGGSSSENTNPRSLRKMQSESKLSSVRFSLTNASQFNVDLDEDDVINLTQPLGCKSSPQQNFLSKNSIHRSLESIVNFSPVASRININNYKRKKSLGVQIDDDYVVDTETSISEPDFKNMTPVELKQMLFKYGIRTLPVKKAVSILEFIYEQLHPKIRATADVEIDENDSRREMNITDIVTNIGVQDSDDFVFQIGLVENEDYILPKMRKSKTPTCYIPLHISFYNMVRSNEKLQKFILDYRAIELDQIHKHFRKFGLTYQPNDIIGFLDKRCITFKTKEQSSSKLHERKIHKRTQRTQKKQ